MDILGVAGILGTFWEKAFSECAGFCDKLLGLLTQRLKTAREVATYAWCGFGSQPARRERKPTSLKVRDSL
jgi:hypothetical protein